MGAVWKKMKRYKLTVGMFCIEYDNAKELGEASADIWHIYGELIENPYEPDSFEYDKFNEAKYERRMILNKPRN